MSKADDERIKRALEILEALQAADLPTEDRVKLSLELDALGPVVDPPPKLPRTHPLTKDFCVKPLPDLDAIYGRKAELDRKFFGEGM